MGAIFGVLKLVPARAWEWLAVLLLLAAYTGFIYYKGTEAYRRKFEQEKGMYAALVAQTKTMGEQAKKDADARNAANQRNKEQADAKHQKDVAALADAWAAEYDRLRKQSDSARRRAVSRVAVSAKLSCDAAANAAISAAVSESVAGARAALDECESGARQFRDTTARLFEQADRNTEALMCGVTWAQGIK